MGLAAVHDGLVAAVATVSGLATVLGYEPAVVNEAPLAYCLVEGTRGWLSESGEYRVRAWRGLARVLVRWQERERAEAQVVAFMDAIPAAIGEDASLGGASRYTPAQVTAVDAGWMEVGGTAFATVDAWIEGELIEAA